MSIISKCSANGMTVKVWYKDHDSVEQTYHKNLKNLQEEMLKFLPAPIIQDDNKPTAFKKLEISTLVPNTKATVSIHLGSATIKVNEGTHQQTILAVLLAGNQSLEESLFSRDI